MKIKEVADKLNVSQRAIRFYEEKGLLSPIKLPTNQYRTFTEQDIWRLQTILSLREAGMTIEDIRSALAQLDAGEQEELQYYLELQRSVMFSQWVEMKHLIETTDRMIHLLQMQQSLPLEAFYQLAEGSKRLREQRRTWVDRWSFDRLAASHDQSVKSDSTLYPSYEEALELTVRWVSPMAGEAGLDLGTGTGNLAGRLLQAGVRMVGVDQSKEMLKACRRKFPELETKLGNFLAIPCLDGQFDFVVTSFAFHHLTGDQQALALDEMRRVLKPRGRICITDLMHTDVREEGQSAAADLPQLLAWFDARGYMTKHHQISERLHIVCAIPIR
ncbi:MerR family transcriptional regulator [Paenibacillus cremeus]|uniref:Methyltransferase domain-containing protein n=1 Tax=Paenibacillus cremeus TaxID=2163881 RepID=A0A559KF87_9BACL|nr:methyltransferase domain-containing protein [Paenibacillus cremeus]TVY10789.1 methyltransferase domain-containing protein [Paenibacillus cremeus]